MAKNKKTELKESQQKSDLKHDGKDRTVIVIDEPVKIEWQKNWLKIFRIGSKRKQSNSKSVITKKAKPLIKNQQKIDMLESKRLAKEAKILYKNQKKDQKISKNFRKTELKENLDPSNIQLDSKRISKETRKKIQVKKPKDENQKFDFKQATREFPVKMIKEVNKIKWSGAENLTKKYITVIVFMAIFALVFFFIDWGLQALFVLMKVI